jgi:hypothetical protein
MSSRRQRLAEAMSRKDWPSVAHSRQVARDDVEDPHKSTWQDEPFTASLDRASVARIATCPAVFWSEVLK